MPHKTNPEGYLSVTEILDLTINKKFLQYWRGKVGNQVAEQIMRESQEIGTEVHAAIESAFNNVAPQGSPRTLQMVQNFFTKFVEPYEVKPVSLEITLKDEKLKLQGTYDALVYTNKGQYVADWKTSNSLDKVSVPLQLSMYAYLNTLSEKPSGLDGVNQGVAVRIDKESDKIDIHWYENLKQYEKIWRATLKLARYIKFGVEEK